MSKTVFLYVYGDDYSALGFERKYNVQDVYEQMVAEEVTKKVIENDEYYIEAKIEEFGEIDPDFVSFMLNNLCDYDQLKSENIYKVM